MDTYRISDAELLREQRGVVRGSVAAIALSAAVLGAAHFVLPKLVRFPGGDIESALNFWAGASLFVVLWVILGIRLVSQGRRHSALDIRGSAFAPPSERIAVQAAFLQNTLEQAVVMMVTHFAMLMLLRESVMPLIAASVVLFSFGRLSFYRNYPKGAAARAFGMALTAVPSIVAFVAALLALVHQIWQ
ncbi:MAPEG family protein [Caenimonas sedimenti]|uniref:MAPEG family protein n=1 Tax=Caenimonas sedimenti TaxID=2596921 RepID=A0A562ZE21_9BURK|nr:MAPEG family protein [Caenimonas sedimenti]TWO64411.1 MAPEG family protein [Caenimonas sedimenti]